MNKNGVFAAIRTAAATHQLLTVGTVLCVAASVGEAEWANLLQHDLPGRNVFGIDLPFFRFQAGYRYVQMQWLRFVYPQL